MGLLDEYKPKIKRKKLTPRQRGTNPRAKGTNPRNMAKKSKAIIVGKSDRSCPQCKGNMVVKKHKHLTEKIRKQAYYFQQWDYCDRCNKVFFDERFRVANPIGQMYNEMNRQNSFIASI